MEIKSQRLIIVNFSNEYLEDYFTEFTDEITQFQYPDSFKDIQAAEQLVSHFVAEMQRGEMLEMVILTPGGEFIGSIEAFGIKGETPEVGLWIKKSAQGLGYGREALTAMLSYLSAEEKYQYFIYEADVRNQKSLRLVESFDCEKKGCEDVTTESGKKLRLQTYHIRPI